MQHGYVVTGFYEYNESPYTHSINDSISNLDLDYVFEVTKSSLAGSLYFTGAKDVNTRLPGNSALHQSFNVHPNPFVTSFKVENRFNQILSLSLMDAQGRLIEKFSLSENSITTISPATKDNLYFYVISDETGKQYDSGKIIKL